MNLKRSLKRLQMAYLFFRYQRGVKKIRAQLLHIGIPTTHLTDEEVTTAIAFFRLLMEETSFTVEEATQGIQHIKDMLYIHPSIEKESINEYRNN